MVRNDYAKKYYLEHKEYFIDYRLKHKEHKKICNREYHKKNTKSRYVKYIGVTVCSKCGKKGYMELWRTVNEKTGSFYNFLSVDHTIVVNHKQIHVGRCYNGNRSKKI